MNHKKEAEAHQMLELSFLMIKRLKGRVMENRINEAIGNKDDTFWPLFDKAAEALTTKWTKGSDGIVYVSVTSNGFSGERWREYFGENASENACKLLESPEFNPGKKGTIHHIAILPGSSFSIEERKMENIRSKAATLKMSKPPTEITCLIRQKFSNEDIKAMGLRCIIGMSDPIEVDKEQHLLAATAFEEVSWLRTRLVPPDAMFVHEDGFAFTIPQNFSILNA